MKSALLMGRDRVICTTYRNNLASAISAIIDGDGVDLNGSGVGSIQHVGARTMGSPVQGYVVLQLAVLHDGWGTQHAVAMLEKNSIFIWPEKRAHSWPAGKAPQACTGWRQPRQRPHTPFCTPCRTPERALMHTRLERVHATASTRCGRGETAKPIFILDRVASSMELIAAAHAALRHVDGDWSGAPGHDLRGGM